MRRKDPPQAQSAGRGKSLISTRTMQQQQRKTQSSRSLLPRSYSSPAPQHDSDVAMPQSIQRGYVIRSYSTPDPKQMDYRRNSDSFYRPKAHGSRGELDSDLENFEQFEECFIDIDADQEEGVITQYRSPERDEPRKVMTSLLPGSGLQRVSLRPIHSATQTLQSAREVMKKMQKDDSKVPSRLNFRPLVMKMPARHMLHSERDPPSPGVEELQSSPQLELEAAELDRELDNAERHLDKGVAIATEESDADTSITIVEGMTTIAVKVQTLHRNT
uniref:Uncharacterized protein n=1 Tax=Heliothis virescens TaxID=7102 RepID=A0A2A4JZQ8_HELVI